MYDYGMETYARKRGRASKAVHGELSFQIDFCSKLSTRAEDFETCRRQAIILVCRYSACLRAHLTVPRLRNARNHLATLCAGRA